MIKCVLVSVLLSLYFAHFAWSEFVLPSISGRQLYQGDARFELRGFAYSPTPIGEDPEAGEFPSTYKNIELIERDGPYLAQAGANTIRIYGALGVDTNGVYSIGTSKEYIREAARHGLWVVMGTFIAPETDFSDAALRKKIIEAHVELVREFKGSSNILMWAPGNEVNISLVNESELLIWYTLLDQIAEAIKAEQGGVGIGLGPYVCAINGATSQKVIPGAEIATQIDIWAANIFVGPSLGSLFQEVILKTDKPFWIAEMGIDRFDNSSAEEDEISQALYVESLWDQIRTHCDIVFGANLGFYSDEWWKGDSLGECLDSANICDASKQDPGGTAFGNGPDGFINEEWLGVVSVSTNRMGGVNEVTPKLAYYTIQELWLDLDGPCTVKDFPAPLEARFDAFNLSRESSNNYGGSSFGNYGFTHVDVLVSSDVPGVSAQPGDYALRVSAVEEETQPFTHFLVIVTLDPFISSSKGIDFSAMDTLSFDAKINTPTAHARWSVRLEDADLNSLNTEFNNLHIPLPPLSTSFQKFDLKLEDFLDEDDPVDLTRLLQIVFVADSPSSAFGPFEFDVVIDNLQIKSSLDGFSAYNDLSWASGQRTGNITKYTTDNGVGDPPEGYEGFLIDYLSGSVVQAHLKVTGGQWNGDDHAQKGSPSVQGTDAFEYFNEKIDTRGVLSYGNSPIELHLSALDPRWNYNLLLFGNRADLRYADLLTTYTLCDVASFKNESSLGTDFYGLGDPSTQILNGDNTLNGYVARFTDIDPGHDGVFKVVISDGGSTPFPRYYVNALSLEAVMPDIEEKIIGETGVIVMDQPRRDAWHLVELSHVYVRPVVVVQPISSNAFEPAHSRVRNVFNDSFEVKIEEWEYQDGIHATESMHYIVFESGVYRLDDGTLLEARTEILDGNWNTIDLKQSFESSPIVLASLQTFNGTDPVVIHMDDVEPDRFQARLREEEAKGFRSSRHTQEAVGIIAVECAVGSGSSLIYEVSMVEEGITHEWSTIHFDQRFSTTPLFIANPMSEHGSNTFNLRYRNLNTMSVDVRLEEETSRDDELVHVSESVGYIAMEANGLITIGTDP